MIRLGMLQFRIQAIIAAVTVAAFTVLLAATGPHLASAYAADGLDSCRGSSCLSPATYFTASLAHGPYGVLFLLSTGIILLAPAVIGLFWGAPLIAREMETGTAALAWNQSVTRTRWLAVKLAVGGLAAMAVTEALSLMQTWWAVPISRAVADGSGAGVAQSRFSQLNFATHGITPLGYAAFAFALGVTAGALIRRTVPAMAVTLAIFAALQVAMPLWVRPNLAPPSRTVIPVTSLGGAGPSQTGPDGDTFTLYANSIPGQPGAWLLSSGPVNAAGEATSTTPAACTSVGNAGQSEGAQGTAFGPGQGPAAFVACLGRHGIREAITYQPASRYWRFQRTETAIYLALALALTGYCFRRLSRPS
ncbi:MAG: ABC transporter permease subunit [Streptosporangiaceae bacterium]|nr:ABC transporter permease subunit [Streptosporangiaceae bacterium]